MEKAIARVIQKLVVKGLTALISRFIDKDSKWGKILTEEQGGLGTAFGMLFLLVFMISGVMYVTYTT